MKRIIFLIIFLYQKAISPWFGDQCRFYPSCSEYLKQALHRYRTEQAVWFGFKRIIRCHPWHPGGIDQP